MELTSSYQVKILHYHHLFDETVTIYQKAVAFFLRVCEQHGSDLLLLKSKDRNNYLEKLTVKTKRNPNPKYDFNKVAYKMPSYLRRAAAQTAIGSYCSFVSNYANWLETDQTDKPPKLVFDHNTMPTLYKGNMFLRLDDCTARIKVYHKKDWHWVTVGLRKQDVNYINKHCLSDPDVKEQSPTLKRVGKRWKLVFPFVKTLVFPEVDIADRVVCSVDLGLNNNAVCSILTSNGTVVARTFINLAAEKDRLYTGLNRQKKAQQHYNKKTPILWKHVNDQNTDISRKTAKGIMEFAMKYQANVIVFEHLEFTGKKKGAKKQKLALWRKQEIQKLVAHQAHKKGIRLSRICAWGTSRLAFDGSGRVTRGSYQQNGQTKYNYSICVFPNGKTYNCDLNASYNIGARYFVRELLKSEQVIARLPLDAKDHPYGTGTTRTLSTLIKLDADLCALTCA